MDDIDVLLEDDRWNNLNLEQLVERAVKQSMARLGIEAEDIELTVLGADDARISTLNAEFRDKPTPTNVLSWPAQDLIAGEMPIADPDGTLPLGDIALAFETCEREAQQGGLQFDHHVTHLLVHGFLHLLGYDHQSDDEAEVMEALEVEILAEMGLNNPYIQ